MRADPRKLDLLLAAALAAGAEAQVVFGGIATEHRLVAAIVVGAMAAAVAVRRAYPAAAGTTAAVLMATELGIWGDPQVICAGIALFCALYGLTVWTTTRRFAIGTAIAAIADMAASLGGHTVLAALGSRASCTTQSLTTSR